MGVIKKYMTDTYCYAHKAKVTKIEKDEKGVFVWLDETIFHPQGGAQPSDTGTIAGKKVVGLAHVNDEINHYLETVDGLQIGDEVELLVDEKNRLQNAVLHSTGHIMAAILRENYNMKEQTGANHFPGQASVKFKTSSVKYPDADEMTKKVQSIIDEKRPMNIIDISGDRCLAIEGLDAGLRCGGTHLKNTEEVSEFQIRNVKFDKKKQEVSYGYHCNHLLLTKPKLVEVESPVNAKQASFAANQ